jgi:hypothetical protein
LVAMFVVAIAGLSFFSIASRGRSTNLGSTRTKTSMQPLGFNRVT